MADDTQLTDQPDTDQIERDLAQTRARMDRRLDELGERLAPNQLVNDALAHVSGGDGADFAATLIAKAKANPIPAALAGVGIAWLMASSGSKTRGEPDLPTRLRSAETAVVRLDDEHPDIHASRVDDARGQVLGIARTASDTAASYSQRIKDAVASAGEAARRTSHDLGDRAAALTGTSGGARALAGSPLAMGAGAALVGLIVGALVPLSDSEEEALGGFADQLRSQGRDLAQQAVDRGAEVAGEALGAAKDSAQAHGFTADKPVGELLGDLRSGDLADHVKQAGHEVLDAGKDSLQAKLGSEGERPG